MVAQKYYITCYGYIANRDQVRICTQSESELVCITTLLTWHLLATEHEQRCSWSKQLLIANEVNESSTPQNRHSSPYLSTSLLL